MKLLPLLLPNAPFRRLTDSSLHRSLSTLNVYCLAAQVYPEKLGSLESNLEENVAIKKLGLPFHLRLRFLKDAASLSSAFRMNRELDNELIKEKQVDFTVTRVPSLRCLKIMTVIPVLCFPHYVHTAVILIVLHELISFWFVTFCSSEILCGVSCGVW